MPFPMYTEQEPSSISHHGTICTESIPRAEVRCDWWPACIKSNNEIFKRMPTVKQKALALLL